jgi:hypothetical protein
MTELDPPTPPSAHGGHLMAAIWLPLLIMLKKRVDSLFVGLSFGDNCLVM